jgi:hypothetical protein
MAYEISATAKKNATISSYSAQCENSKLTTSSGTFTKAEAASFTFSATDNRGLSITNTRKLTLIEYFKPTISTSVKLALTGDTTISAEITISGKFYNGSFGAVANTLDIQIKRTGATSWTSIGVSPTINGRDYTAKITIDNLDYQTAFTYQCRVVDKLETVAGIEETKSYLPVFDWSKNDFNFNVNVNMHGDTVMRHTTGDVKSTVLSAQGGNIYLRPNGTNSNVGQLRIHSDGTASLNGNKLATIDMIYPVGAIYISVNTTNPSTFFGGTWERIQDRFLLAAGSTYANGSTGGAATVTLTTEQMPKHSHDMPFSGSSSGTQSPYPYYIKSATTLNDTGGKGYRNNLGTFEIGGGAAHNNMPPYLAVYMWKRTA